MKQLQFVIPGGSGQVGRVLQRQLRERGHRVTVLSRHPNGAEGDITWDGKSLGAWAAQFEGADVVVNLAGRSVNCRYTDANLEEMMASRVESTRVVGQAIAACKQPPRVWLQASTATIYAHRFDAPNDEISGIIGGGEPGSPRKWDASIEIAKAWERELEAAETPKTRKVAMRSAMTMSPDKGGIFDVMATLARRGLGGQAGDGRQYVSWVHDEDFVRSVLFLVEREELDGPINICSPNPLPNREFFRILRQALDARVGLPAPAWMLEIGAVFMKTETELLLKSRRVVPSRLLEAGFVFEYPVWPKAARELADRWNRKA